MGKGEGEERTVFPCEKKKRRGSPEKKGEGRRKFDF